MYIEEEKDLLHLKRREKAWEMARAFLDRPVPPKSSLLWVLSRIQSSEAEAVNLAHQREVKEREKGIEDQRLRTLIARALTYSNLNSISV